MSNPRWPQTCTTCWPTMDTNWTVAALSRWRGRGRWPPTSSPAAPRVVNDWPEENSHCIDETERSACHRAIQTHRGQDEADREESKRWRSLRCTHVGRCSCLQAFSRAAQEITQPSCLIWKRLCLCIAIVQVFEVFYLFLWQKQNCSF